MNTLGDCWRINPRPNADATIMASTAERAPTMAGIVPSKPRRRPTASINIMLGPGVMQISKVGIAKPSQASKLMTGAERLDHSHSIVAGGFDEMS
jgi:hypothetical protein